MTIVQPSNRTCGNTHNASKQYFKRISLADCSKNYQPNSLNNLTLIIPLVTAPVLICDGIFFHSLSCFTFLLFSYSVERRNARVGIYLALRQFSFADARVSQLRVTVFCPHLTRLLERRKLLISDLFQGFWASSNATWISDFPRCPCSKNSLR